MNVSANLKQRLATQEQVLLNDLEKLREEYQGTLTSFQDYPMYNFDICIQTAKQKIQEAYFWIDKAIIESK